MAEVLLKVASFVLAIAAGFAASHTGALGEDAGRMVSKIVFNLTLPAAIVRAFASTELDLALLPLIGLGLLASLVPFFASLVAYRGLPGDERIVQQCNVSGFNVGSFGLPFVQAFFPAEGVVATCLFDAGNSLMGTGGSWALINALMLGGAESPSQRIKTFLRSLFSSVPFDCYVVLIALGAAGVPVPSAVLSLVEPPANANSFLSMFMIGLMIRFEVDAKRVRELARLLSWRFATSIALLLLVAFVLPLEGSARTALAVLAWAPAASTGPLYTLWARGDAGLAGMANAATVLAGVVAMTALVLVMGV